MENKRLEGQHLVETWALRKFVSQRWEEGAAGAHLPKVSIVIPAFNQVDFLERTILSILNQNYSNLELLVIDGGSTDGMLELLEDYVDVIDYFHTGADSGQSDALNHGFSKATGDIMAWMNSDDLYLPGAISAAVERFESDPSALIVYGDWWSIDKSDRVLEINHAFDFNVGHFLYEGFHLNSQAMFWRSEVHQRFGNFDIELHRTMDYDFILRLGLREKIGSFSRVPLPLACFRRYDGQKTSGDGMSEIVKAEHRTIASNNDCRKKFSIAGKLARIYYRFRRMWWYLKRDGLDLTLYKIRSRAK